MFEPPVVHLEKYAQVLVRYALNSGSGMNPEAVVQISVPDVAKQLGIAIRNEVLRAGGHPLFRLLPTESERSFYELASEKQLRFFPETYLRSRADLLDHSIGIIAEPNPNELAEIEPAKIMTSRSAQKPFRDWLFEKERQDAFSWTAALWVTKAKADLVGLTPEAYWDQIVHACFLDADDPVAQWRSIARQQRSDLKKLNALSIASLHISGPDVDLTVRIGPHRRWLGGSGSNIPSFEYFITPDWRGTQGRIRFNQPLYRYGSVVTGITLEFRDGRIVSAHAESGEKTLKEMIAVEGADKLGEFSLTDKRLSRITHPMAETLFDENMGGDHGNTHVAVGMGYKDSYTGDQTALSDEEWESLGFNDSAIHTDMISTSERTVTATLADGTTRVIYADGMFQLN